jgi:hypothetical protein
VGNALALSIMSTAMKFVSSRVFVMGLGPPIATGGITNDG